MDVETVEADVQEQSDREAARARQLAGLRPFPPGKSGNPGGRPKGSSILAPILRMLAEGAKDDPNGEGTEAKLLARVAIVGAKNGEDISSILKLIDRTDGAVKQETSVRTENYYLIEEVGREYVGDETP